MGPDIFEYLNYRAFLNAWCDDVRRASHGPSPSARAQKAGISSGMFTNLRKARIPNEQTTEKLIEMLKLSGSQAGFFRLLVEKERAASPDERVGVLKRIFDHPGLWRTNTGIAEFFQDNDAGRLDLDILEMCNRPDFVADAAWIGPRLALSAEPEAIDAALARLDARDLLPASDDSTPQHHTTRPDTGMPLRQAHFDGLELAARALEEIPKNERGFYLAFAPMSDAGLAQAKLELVEVIKNQLHQAQEAPAPGARIYRIQVQVFPVDREPEGTD